MVLPNSRLILAVAAFWLLAVDAAAQTGAVGIGPRFSFVRGSSREDIGSARYSGGALRAALSRRTALELSIDYRSHINESLTERVKDYPIQGSLLLYPVRLGLAPYFLVSLGWYTQRIDTLDNTSIIDTTTTRKMGYHAGLGGELRVRNRVGLHLDYRYTFIRFGEAGADAEPGAVPVPGLTAFQERLKLSHEGSMWTTGVTVYF